MRGSLDRQVLVLNRLWQPVNICTARRAVGLLFLGHAQVVHADEEQNFFTHDVNSWLEFSEQFDSAHAEVVRSISRQFRVPYIIVLSMFDRLPRKEVKFTRQNVFQRDDYTCQYCGVRHDTRDLNLDHVVPRDKGGKTTWENVVCSCIRCNTRKANKMPMDANMFPMRKPAAPKWRPFFSAGDRQSTASQSFHESWRHFIDLKPASVKLC